MYATCTKLHPNLDIKYGQSDNLRMALPAFVQDFRLDFDQFLQKELDPFAFVRFHDGEYHVMEGLDYKSRSGWSTDGGSTWIQHPLVDALTFRDSGYFLGISSPCDHSEAADYYRSRRGHAGADLTFSSIFAHANYHRFNQIEQRFPDHVTVGPTEKCDFKTPSNGVNNRWDVDSLVNSLLAIENKPIFVAAGPCANVIIHRYWLRQEPSRRVPIFDVGAAIDERIHGKATRDYHGKKKSAADHRCDWDSWVAFQPLTESRRLAAARRGAQAARFAQLQSEGFSGSIGPYRSPGITRERRSDRYGSHIKDQRPAGPYNNRNVRYRNLPKKKP